MSRDNSWPWVVDPEGYEQAQKDKIDPGDTPR